MTAATGHGAAALSTRARAAVPIVYLAGNPNAGKTTVFNLLTGARARVGNYPGVTVDRFSARLMRAKGSPVELVDLPGAYSLSARSPEEQITVDCLLPLSGASPDGVVVVLDATAIERSLYLALSLIATGVPTVVALNMMDEATSQGTTLDIVKLERELGTKVVPLAAAKGEGKQALLDAIFDTVDTHLPKSGDSTSRERSDSLRSPEFLSVEKVVAELYPADTPDVRAERARWALLSLGDDELRAIPERLRQAASGARASAAARNYDIDRELIADRYAEIERIVAACVRVQTRTQRSRTERVDSVLTHPVLGFAVFIVVMLMLFEGLFRWAEPLVSAIEHAVVFAQNVVHTTLPDGPFSDLVASGVIAGVGNVVVFVPQIAMLFLFLGVLEDSGYLARVAYLIDRLMRGVGLNGKAFVPLLSGFACAIPAVMATRTIENRRDRLITMLAVPLMSCSARLPIYTLIIATLFVGKRQVFGVVSAGSLVLLAMYGLSLIASLATASLLRRTVLKGPRPPLVLELPPYRLPILRNLVLGVWARVRTFLVDAGSVILALTVVLWALLSYPKSTEVHARYETLRRSAVEIVDVTARDQRLAALDAEEARDQLPHSAAGRVGHFVEPALRPLGFDWRIGIGIIGSFAAREVLVSTLGIVYGIDDADEGSVPLRDALRRARREDGTPIFTPLSGLSLMVFFVLACQCMSTLAVVRRESGSWRWPAALFTYMTVLAYVSALVVYQVGVHLRLGLS